MLIAVGGFTPIGFNKLSRPNNKKLYRRIKNAEKLLWKKIGEFYSKKLYPKFIDIDNESFSEFSLIEELSELVSRVNGITLLGRAALFFIFCFSVFLFSTGVGLGNGPPNKVQDSIILSATLPIKQIDTTISFSAGDFTGSYYLKGDFNREGFKIDSMSFTRNVEFSLTVDVFSWFGTSDNNYISKYNVDVEKNGENYKITFISTDSSDKYRTIIFNDGQEIGVYTNQNIVVATGLGESSDVASGWVAGFSNVKEEDGKLKLDLSVSKVFVSAATIGADGVSFPLEQLKVFGEFDRSKEMPANFLEICFKPSMQVNYGRADANGTIGFKDTLLTKVIIVKVTNGWKYPENEAKWFASTSYGPSKSIKNPNGRNDYPILGAIYTIGMTQRPDKTFNYPISLVYADSSNLYPKKGYYATAGGIFHPVDIKIRGPPYDSTTQTDAFGSLSMKREFDHVFVLRKGQDYYSVGTPGSNLIGFKFGTTLWDYSDTMPRLMTDGIWFGDAVYNGNYVDFVPRGTTKDTTIDHNLRVKVIRPDSLIIWDTDVRAQVGATFKLDLRSFQYEKQAPTGVEEQMGFIKDFTVYPNPSNGVIIIKSGNFLKCRINITNLLGQTVWQGVMDGSEKTIDIKELPSGTYIIAVGAVSKIFEKI